MSILFLPTTIGSLALKNRGIMAPLTRARGGEVRVPNDVMLKYYVQRASAGLILSEATSVMPMEGFKDTHHIKCCAIVQIN